VSAPGHVAGFGDIAGIDRYTRIVVSRLGAPLLQGLEAATFMTRLRGLHALPPPGPGDALLIRPCRAVQTWRMRYPIDVIFLDDGGTVLKLCRGVQGSVAICRGSVMVIETASGTAARLGLRRGQTLTVGTGERA